jgi:hypothetical protein
MCGHESKLHTGGKSETKNHIYTVQEVMQYKIMIGLATKRTRTILLKRNEAGKSGTCFPTLPGIGSLPQCYSSEGTRPQGDSAFSFSDKPTSSALNAPKLNLDRNHYVNFVITQYHP